MWLSVKYLTIRKIGNFLCIFPEHLNISSSQNAEYFIPVKLAEKALSPCAPNESESTLIVEKCKLRVARCPIDSYWIEYWKNGMKLPFPVCILMWLQILHFVCKYSIARLARCDRGVDGMKWALNLVNAEYLQPPKKQQQKLTAVNHSR